MRFKALGHISYYNHGGKRLEGDWTHFADGSRDDYNRDVELKEAITQSREYGPSATVSCVHELTNGEPPPRTKRWRCGHSRRLPPGGESAEVAATVLCMACGQTGEWTTAPVVFDGVLVKWTPYKGRPVWIHDGKLMTDNDRAGLYSAWVRKWLGRGAWLLAAAVILVLLAWALGGRR